MGLESIFILMLMAKHLICDWFLQDNWMAFNKHKLNHPAGYVHAGINVFGSFITILVFFAFVSDDALVITFKERGHLFLLLLLVGEFVTHFLMDFTKMNLNKKMGWSPTTHKQFWDLTGFDQFVHLSYLVFMGGMLV